MKATFLIAMAIAVTGCTHTESSAEGGRRSESANRAINCETVSRDIGMTERTGRGIVPVDHFASLQNENSRELSVSSSGEDLNEHMLAIGFSDLMANRLYSSTVLPDGNPIFCIDWVEQDMVLHLDLAGGAFAERIDVTAEVRFDGLEYRTLITGTMPMSELKGTFDVMEYRPDLRGLDTLNVLVEAFDGRVTRVDVSARSDDPDGASPSILSWYAPAPEQPVDDSLQP